MPIRFLLLLTLILTATLNCCGQENVQGSDTRSIPNNTQIADSLAVHLGSDILTNADTMAISDTLIRTDSTVTADTIKPRVRRRGSQLQDKVVYNATDSMRISVDGRMLYMYNNAFVNYQDIELKANYIALDFGKNEVFAKGTYDSSGTATGLPNFKKGNESFDCDSLKYNFKTEGDNLPYHHQTG